MPQPRPQPVNKIQYFTKRFTHVMRRPCWCTKQWQNIAQVLHNNRIKFPKDFFRYCSLSSVHQHGRCDVTRKPRISQQVDEISLRTL